MVRCGDGSDAAHLAHGGFAVHVMDISSAHFTSVERYGVRTHCASATEFWLFENGSFDSVMDVLCYRGEPDPDKRAFYRSELKRVLKRGGYYLISLQSAPGAREAAAREFAGFEIVASGESEGRLHGTMAIRVLNLIMKRK
ncbi:class I SAM-dependent methyltransferase [Candidatus Micrarchaeota archaeon]|nr:class I SAM-dependent methyltransferase [Candidatus Micrarchaeota archaeon]